MGSGGRLFDVVDIKSDRPTVEEARRRLNAAIADARRQGIQVLKVIHGYGSSGVGGALRDAVRASLRRRRKDGLIREIVHGEKWDIFDERTQKLLEQYPGLKRDQDLSRGNEGVTLVVL
jgi:hypothetical protein